MSPILEEKNAKIERMKREILQTLEFY